MYRPLASITSAPSMGVPRSKTAAIFPSWTARSTSCIPALGITTRPFLMMQSIKMLLSCSGAGTGAGSGGLQGWGRLPLALQQGEQAAGLQDFHGRAALRQGAAHDGFSR